MKRLSDNLAFACGAALGFAFLAVGFALDVTDRAYDSVASRFAIPPRTRNRTP